VPDIFDEVDEELRADRAQALFKRHGGTLLAVAIAIVLAAGGYQSWRWYDQKRIAGVASEYIGAMRTEAEKGPGRDAALLAFASVADKGNAGYRTLARLQEAGLKAAKGDLAGASVIWDAVAADRGADPLLRDLATLQWAIHHLDTADPAQLAAGLAPLAAPSNAWHPLAAEALAMLDLRQGKREAARTALQALAQDPLAPQGVRRRADGLLARLGQ
jgi:hypothetical protein